MAWTKGLNFRTTSGYVTDAADDTYILNNGGAQGEQYPVTRNGVTFGYTSTLSVVQTRDRNSGNNAKLAGVHFTETEASAVTVRVDLPATGDYNVRVGAGDATYARTGMKILIKDNGSTQLTVSGDTAGANNFLDASSTNLTHANWVSSNTPTPITFGSTIAEITIGNGAAGPSMIAHVSFDQVETVANTDITVPSARRLVAA